MVQQMTFMRTANRRRSRSMRLAALGTITLTVVSCGHQDPGRTASSSETPPAAHPVATTQIDRDYLAPISDPHLPNAHRINEKVICGGQPDGPDGFARLATLGVRTVISVDGIRPNVELAHQYGMRYIHLPFGYDTVPQMRGEEIAKAIDEMPGAIYIHCHHGQHRAPAAVAVACVYNGMLPPEQVDNVLKVFGTGENYAGLWKSARAARPLELQSLSDLKVDFVETAKIPPLADAMVNVDETLDHLKRLQKSGWKATPDQGEVDPSHEALQMTELLHEIARSEAVAGKPDAFKVRLNDAEQAAEALRTALATVPPSEASPSGESADARFNRLVSSCTACHKDFRN
jgi:protein tyrosine phosphatase (PTP) superfamily phosphohydrolase (DUF442 family)